MTSHMNYDNGVIFNRSRNDLFSSFNCIGITRLNKDYMHYGMGGLKHLVHQYRTYHTIGEERLSKGFMEWLIGFLLL